MRMRQLAVIDLGSNTTRLIVMAYAPGEQYKLVDEIRERVRLAEGMGPGNVLRLPAVRRAVKTMEMFAAFCRAHGIRRVIPVATSAVRDATNRAALLAEVRARAGLSLRVLGTREEAHYATLGALNSMDLRDGYVVDLGGGSLQVAEVRGRRLVRSASLPLGTVRLTEAFVRSDPLDNGDAKALARYLREAFAALDWFKAGDGKQLVGLGGTIRNLAKIDRAERDYPLDLLHGYVLPAESVRGSAARLQRLPVARRAQIAGLKADRADVILAGALAVRALLEHSGFEELTICGHGVREGLFFEVFMQGRSRPLIPDVRRFSVLNLARQYHYEPKHAAHVAHLAVRVLEQLDPDASDDERALLWAAAQLHDIGMAVDYRNHHRHSEYLLLNGGLDGYTHREIALLALLARYHRGGTVDLAPFGRLLRRGDEARARRLAALLRLAEYLERGRHQVVRDVQVTRRGGALRLRLLTRGDASVELWDAGRNLELLEEAFGARVVLDG
jgi:exopolyphosphatase/guanosine-5'-triphosphate,3'-diphosphate pyrophosphatase